MSQTQAAAGINSPNSKSLESSDSVQQNEGGQGSQDDNRRKCLASTVTHNIWKKYAPICRVDLDSRTRKACGFLSHAEPTSTTLAAKTREQSQRQVSHVVTSPIRHTLTCSTTLPSSPMHGQQHGHRTNSLMPVKDETRASTATSDCCLVRSKDAPGGSRDATWTK